MFPLKNKENLLQDSIEVSNELVDDVKEIRKSKWTRKEKD